MDADNYRAQCFKPLKDLFKFQWKKHGCSQCFNSLKKLFTSQWKKHSCNQCVNSVGDLFNSQWKKHGPTLKKYNKIFLYFSFNFALSAWDNGTDVLAAIGHFK